jgi:hypothetical protein
MGPWIRFLIVSTIALALTAVLLSITLPCWAGTGTPVFMQNVNGAQQKNDPDQGPAGAWITIDPLPDIPATGDFTISGSCSIPEREEIEIHAIFLFSRMEAGTLRTWSGDYSWGPYPIITTAKDGKKRWYVTGNAQGTPDQYRVEIRAPEYGIYATSIHPSAFPRESVDDTTSWIRLDPTGTHDLGDLFCITGSTNLPIGYPLIIEVYRREFSQEEYLSLNEFKPVLRDQVTVMEDAKGTQYFSLPVNLTESVAKSGQKAVPGPFFVEIHAVNMNSSVSDRSSFEVTTHFPWIRVDTIIDPVLGSNLAVTGTTNLPAGSNISVEVYPAIIPPCPACQYPDQYPGLPCCGQCSMGSLSGIVHAKEIDGAVRSWEFTRPIGTRWCTGLAYSLTAKAEGFKDPVQDVKYFYIRKPS